MNNDNHNNENEWVEIRERPTGRMLFKYNPRTNCIELKRGNVYTLVKLDEIRHKHGYGSKPPYPELLGIENV